LPSNILLLCEECHLDCTEESLWAQAGGMNVHSWEVAAEVPVKLWHCDDMVLLDDFGTWHPLTN
jgi:hypothetical protein